MSYIWLWRTHASDSSSPRLPAQFCKRTIIWGSSTTSCTKMHRHVREFFFRGPPHLAHCLPSLVVFTRVPRRCSRVCIARCRCIPLHVSRGPPGEVCIGLCMGLLLSSSYPLTRAPAWPWTDIWRLLQKAGSSALPELGSFLNRWRPDLAGIWPNVLKTRGPARVGSTPYFTRHILNQETPRRFSASLSLSLAIYLAFFLSLFFSLSLSLSLSLSPSLSLPLSLSLSLCFLSLSLSLLLSFLLSIFLSLSLSLSLSLALSLSLSLCLSLSPSLSLPLSLSVSLSPSLCLSRALSLSLSLSLSFFLSFFYSPASSFSFSLSLEASVDERSS